MSDLHAGFQQSGTAARQQGLFDFLDRVDQLPHIQAIKQRMNDLLDPGPGQHILDIGCGMGHELLRIAPQLSPGGRVLGVDKNTDMIDAARRRSTRVRETVTCETGDVERLDLPDATMDGVRAERVLMYVPDQQRAISEIVRVVKPGGRVVAFELDYGATLIDLPSRSTAQRIFEALAATVPHRWTGRSLARLFHQAGLRDIGTDAFPVMLPYEVHRQLIGPALAAAVEAGTLDAATYQEWLRASADADRSGHHCDTFFGLVACGHKPK